MAPHSTLFHQAMLPPSAVKCVEKFGNTSEKDSIGALLLTESQLSVLSVSDGGLLLSATLRAHTALAFMKLLKRINSDDLIVITQDGLVALYELPTLRQPPYTLPGHAEPVCALWLTGSEETDGIVMQGEPHGCVITSNEYICHGVDVDGCVLAVAQAPGLLHIVRTRPSPHRRLAVCAVPYTPVLLACALGGVNLYNCPLHWLHAPCVAW